MRKNIAEKQTIYVENCLKTILRIPDNFVDLIMTSPPYDGLRLYKGFTFSFKDIARGLSRILKPGGVLVWVVGDEVINGSESGTSFKQALYFKDKCYLNLHDTMIYEKVGLTMNHNRYEQEFEYMFIFSNGRPATFNPIKVRCSWYGKEKDRSGTFTGIHAEANKKLRSNNERGKIKPKKIKGNIWRYSTGFGKSTKDEIAFKHPAIFPDKLAADHIQSWTNEGDLIYDPFGGSGTVAKVAEVLKRQWILSEISPDYANNIATPRIELMRQKPTLF